MRASSSSSSSSSASSSSSSSYSKSSAAASLNNRLKTVFKKANELSILCQIEVCVIYYGLNGELKTWPKEREKVVDMALRYNAATKRKKSLNLHEFLEKKETDKKKEKDNKEENDKKNPKKKTKRVSESVNGSKYRDWYPVFDHYSPHQLSRLILSLERVLSTLQERLRFAEEAQKQYWNTNLVHPNLTPPFANQHHLQYQTQPLNLSQLSPYTLSQLPFSAPYSNQLINYHNHLMMQQQLYGIDHKPTNINFQHPCGSNTQESGLKNHLMMQQQELYGYHQNMCMTNDISNSNVLQQPHLSNRAPDEFCYDFQNNPCGDMVGSSNNSFSQDFPELLSSSDGSRLLQTSSLPSLHTIPNSYFLSDNSRFL